MLKFIFLQDANPQVDSVSQGHVATSSGIHVVSPSRNKITKAQAAANYGNSNLTILRVRHQKKIYIMILILCYVTNVNVNIHLVFFRVLILVTLLLRWKGCSLLYLLL